jgi:hypothetical protein
MRRGMETEGRMEDREEDGQRERGEGREGEACKLVFCRRTKEEKREKEEKWGGRREEGGRQERGGERETLPSNATNH